MAGRSRRGKSKESYQASRYRHCLTPYLYIPLSVLTRAIIGVSEQPLTESGRPLNPNSVAPFNSKGLKSRSSSTPASEAIKVSNPGNNASRLRHLSMSTSAGQQEGREATRSTLRLTNFPREFVPSSMRQNSSNVPEEVAAGPFFYEDTFATQIPPINQSSQIPFSSTNQRVKSPTTPVATQGFYDPGSGLMKLSTDPPREVNLRETRDYVMPPPRPGSPDADNFDEGDLSQLTHKMTLKPSLPPQKPYKPIPLPPEIEALWNSDDTQQQERDYYMKRYAKLLQTETPASWEVARSLDLSPTDYEMLKMRDVVRKTIPESTFPFFNGDDVDDRVYNYPPEIQKAYFRKTGFSIRTSSSC